MERETNNRIEELAREKLQGKSYSKIREELRTSGLAEEELRQLIRQVDQRVLMETVEQGDRQRTQQWYRWGLVLAVAGLILSIGYNAGMVLNNLPALAVYSPFLAGILLMFYGRMMLRKKSRPIPRGPGPIRKKRPYK
ncbi:MAG: hypothetical protein E4H10_11505 [Bacteroidia bacterium]|nr:MAG: hypothetical protein E4H10_11505 [Bacteroidia bacterium]